MSWWGKLFGGTFGFFLGGPLGGLLGIAVGHNLDRSVMSLRRSFGGFGVGKQYRIQSAFFTATFSVMGHLARIDGNINKNELVLAQIVMDQMQLKPEQKQAAVRLFEEGKRLNFPLGPVIHQLKKECKGRRNLLRMFVEILIHSAYADGEMNHAEKTLLLKVCSILGLNVNDFDRMDAMIRAQRDFTSTQSIVHEQQLSQDILGHSYAILGVAKSVSDIEIKKAYRRLLNQHHPDKLVAKGLPEEMTRLATQKTHEIRTAYDLIRKVRGFQ